MLFFTSRSLEILPSLIISSAMSWDPNAGYSDYDNSSTQNQQHQQPMDPYNRPNPVQNRSRPGSRTNQPIYGGGQQQMAMQPPYDQQQQSYYNPNQQPLQQQAPFQSDNSYGGGFNSQQNQGAYRSNQGQQSYNQPGGMPGQFPFGNQVNPMMANMAMQYGQDIVGKGQEEFKKNLDKYVSIGQLKYYFAVDNAYVTKKLGLLLFPFSHSDWSIKYAQEEPVQPKYDVNAPDLYIPCMSFVTYLLLVGYVLGLRNAFSPDLLATTASSALVWLVLELAAIYLTLTLMSINSNLCKWDVLAFSTYKYVAMIAVILSGLLSQSKSVYYGSLAYTSSALALFLIRTLKLRIEPETHGMQAHGKRKLYMLLFYAGLQPLLMWWMTSYFSPMTSPVVPPPLYHDGAPVNAGADGYATP